MYEGEDSQPKNVSLGKRDRPKYPRSKPKDNVDSLLEAQLSTKRQEERGLTRKYKKRHLNELSAASREEMIRLYHQHHMLQRDIAKYFKVSESLVGRILKQARDEVEKLEEQMQREARQARATETIKNVATDMLQRN